MKKANFKKIYEEILSELCEDVGINVKDADLELEAIANEITVNYIKEN